MKALLLFLFCSVHAFSQNYGFVCKFDKAGRRKTCTHTYRGAQGGLDAKTLHYDANGRVTKIEIRSESAPEEEPPYEAKMIYDAKGLLLKNGDTRYTYNYDGQLSSMVYHVGMSTLENKFLYADKVLTTGFFTEETGTECVYYNTRFEQKPLILKDSITWELKEAFMANRIDSIFGFDKKGKLISTQRWYYDQKGQRVKRVEWGSVTELNDLDKELLYLEQWKNNFYTGYTLICQVCGGGAIVYTKKFDAKGKLLFDSSKRKQ